MVLMSAMLFSMEAKADDPNQLCAFGYISKIEASPNADGDNKYYFYKIHFDTMGFNSPLKKVNLRGSKKSLVNDTYESLIFTELTAHLRSAFTAHMPVRVHAYTANMESDYCSGDANELKIEVCTTLTCDI